MNPVERIMYSKLKNIFNPLHVRVINESYKHNVPHGSETHFQVIVVADTFKDLPLIKRHRLVNETLQEQLSNGVHALSIVAKTPSEWSMTDGEPPGTPACRGGFNL